MASFLYYIAVVKKNQVSIAYDANSVSDIKTYLSVFLTTIWENF